MIFLMLKNKLPSCPGLPPPIHNHYHYHAHEQYYSPLQDQGPSSYHSTTVSHNPQSTHQSALSLPRHFNTNTTNLLYHPEQRSPLLRINFTATFSHLHQHQTLCKPLIPTKPIHKVPIPIAQHSTQAP